MCIVTASAPHHGDFSLPEPCTAKVSSDAHRQIPRMQHGENRFVVFETKHDDAVAISCDYKVVVWRQIQPTGLLQFADFGLARHVRNWRRCDLRDLNLLPAAVEQQHDVARLRHLFALRPAALCRVALHRGVATGRTGQAGPFCACSSAR